MAKTATVRVKKPTTAARVAGVDEKTIANLLNIFKSLSDKSRLQILLMLARDGELTVKALCGALGQSQPAVSHHLKDLLKARLVEFRREGKFNFYSAHSELVQEIVAKFYPAAKSAQQKLVYGSMELHFKAK